MRRQCVPGCFASQSQRGSFSGYYKLLSTLRLGLAYSVRIGVGWGLVCETTWETTTSTNTFGRPVLENSYDAHARMATVLVHLLWWLSSGFFGIFCVEWELLAQFFMVVFSVHCLSHYMRDSLKRGTLWIKGTVNGVQVVKRAVTKP